MVLGLLALGACRTTPPARVEEAPDPAAVLLHDEGLARLWHGDREGALERFRDALGLDAAYVSAHRHRQILEGEQLRRASLLQEYRSWLGQDPTDTSRWYLLGRLASDPARQEEAFRAAASRDPEHPWINFGLGQLALMRGQPEEAEECFRRGLRRAPGNRDLRLGLARSLLRQAKVDLAEGFLQDLDQRHPGDPDVHALLAQVVRMRDGIEAALHWMGRKLARDPWMDAVADQARSLLEEDGSQGEARWMLTLLRETLRQRGGGSQSFLALLFRAAVQAGDWQRAAEWGGGLEARPVSWERDWRRALFRTGQWHAGILTAERTFAALAHVGQDVSAYREACRQAAELVPGGPPEPIVGFARSLRHLGWSEEALLVLEGQGDSGLSRDLQQQLAFEAELEALARDAYRAFQQRGEIQELDEFLAEVAGASLRLLGEDLVEDAARVEIPVVGSLLDPDPATGGALARYFAERGRLVVLGRRVGHPPEVFLAPRIAAGAVGGGPVYLAWVEGEHIPFFLQSVGARLSGAALVRFVYLDAAGIVAQTDAWRPWLEGPAPEEVPPLPAPTARARMRLEEPADVALRLMVRAFADYRRRQPEGGWDGFLGEALQEVLVHEATHLQDEDRLLDLGLHWIPFLPQFLRRGFQPDQLQAWAELRAQCGALRGARNPYLALANAVSFLPRSPYTDQGPHARAYEELMQRFVAVLEEDAARFPSLARDANLLQQLHRLEPDEIRRVAERIARDLGLGPVARGT